MAPARLLNHLLFIGCNLGAAALALALCWLLYASIGARQDAFDDRLATLARYRAVAASGKEASAYVAATRQAAAQNLLVPGKSLGQASANLQARLKSLAEEAGGTVRSVQSLPPRASGGVTLVGARLNMVGGVKEVAGALTALESGAPLLLVAAARLQPNYFMRANVGEIQIEAQLDVYGGASMKEEP